MMVTSPKLTKHCEGKLEKSSFGFAWQTGGWDLVWCGDGGPFPAGEKVADHTPSLPSKPLRPVHFRVYKPPTMDQVQPTSSVSKMSTLNVSDISFVNGGLYTTSYSLRFGNYMIRARL
jgi:hypothetical protein